MTIEQLNDLLSGGDIEKIKSVISFNRDTTAILSAIAQYDARQHGVFDGVKRPKKKVAVMDDQGNVTGHDFIEVTRMAIPAQKKIVGQAVAVLGSPVIDCTPKEGKETTLRDAVQKTEDDNKMDFRFKKISRLAMSEKECAELWYMQPSPEGFWDETGLKGGHRLRMQILHNSYDEVNRTGNDTLYPVFDFYNDMIAFGRGYKLKEDGQEVEHLDIYTADRHYFSKKVNGIWETAKDQSFTYVDSKGRQQKYIGDDLPGVPNTIGKIPVIYYSHPIDWADVQEIIERLEKKISNHADTNDRFDSPILFAEGDVLGFPKGDDTGKLLQGKNGAKASYLTWDNAPESMRMEIENLFKLMYSMTSSADFSFEQVKGLGDLSGVALKMIFMDCHMKASINEEYLGESVQRRYNYLKSALMVIDPTLKVASNLKIKPKFEYFLPQNIPETLANLNSALTAGLISRETAIRLNPLITNPDEEISRIKKEEEEKRKLTPPVTAGVPGKEEKQPDQDDTALKVA